MAKIARNLAMWLAWQNSDLTLREIGSLFGGMDYAAVSQRIRRIQKRAETDKKLQRAFEMLNVRYDLFFSSYICEVGCVAQGVRGPKPWANNHDTSI